MSYFKALLIFLLLISFVSCNDNPVSPVNQELTDNVYELVFHELIVNSASGFKIKPDNPDTIVTAIYLEYHAEMNKFFAFSDPPTFPSDSFMERFKGFPVHIYKGSQCTTTDCKVQDKYTGETGIVFHAGPIENTNDNYLTLYAGWYFSCGNAGMYKYIIYYDSGHLWIVNKKMLWIS